MLSLWPPKIASVWILASPERVLDPDLIVVNPRHTVASYYRVNSSRPTVLTLGDSFTASFPVRRSRSYPSDLRRKLARSGHPMNVINLGMGDSGPDQQLRLLERYALDFVRPHAIIWQFYQNDFWDNVNRPAYTIGAGGLEPIPARQNWLYRRQLLFNSTPLPVFVKLHSRIFGYVLKSTERWAYDQVPAAYANEHDLWAKEKIRLAIDEMERLAKAHGFRAYYLVVPPQATYVQGTRGQGLDWLTKNSSELRSIVASLPGYIDIDFGPDGVIPTSTRFYVGGLRDRAVFGERHLNARGYRSVAQQIAIRLAADAAGGRLVAHAGR